MNTEIIYYKSPVGILEIKSENEFISAILFVNSWKGKKMEESSITFATPSSSVIKTAIKELDEYFAGERKTFSFTMQQNGTEFQQKVWNELLNISYGKTISYLELSKRIGNVKAIRAAGTANGNNNICIAVPCHRVIGSDGSLVGYGGDLWRKKWLLEHEAKFGNGVLNLFDNG
ncbi:methylated-DNA--[protein]-cysteine S-methyltransferase [Ferruginibacter albus]|uniref:methylated-DNA--[protein]-cysteine S-methyltransferase n=1 Tax=Ferruginibacter albus TaxID=2875540 RepID=UPI001CC4EC6D|nr:methylated-DNA--[protein]-cysteine S-methyltransferase [Ferruginibacter albus]UAY51179.1 methylated-DNA--[protein]-cysteine S-methyltransferase [Ferruginibacter albus]